MEYINKILSMLLAKASENHQRVTVRKGIQKLSYTMEKSHSTVMTAPDNVHSVQSESSGADESLSRLNSILRQYICKNHKSLSHVVLPIN
jgi:hypothetical protein